MKKLLICTQQRHAPNLHSCGNGGGIDVATRLENAIRQAGLDVSIERTTCMSKCASGPNVKLLPEGTVWERVDLQKVNEILDVLKRHHN
jgi:(2Fe-2S) ferredoxin